MRFSPLCVDQQNLSLLHNSINQKQQNMQLGLEVSLNGKILGRCSVCTATMIQVNDHNKVRSNTPEEEIQCAIALMCWVHEDDSLMYRDWSEFTVKGVGV